MISKLSGLAIVIPALNESTTIKHLLNVLQLYRDAGAKIVLVDGGSCDNTIEVSKKFVDHILHSEKGRAKQMNLAVDNVVADYYWFVHADTFPDKSVYPTLCSIVESKRSVWGRFSVQILGDSPWFVIIAFMMNLRSCVTGIATGDQALLVSQQLFLQVNQYSDIPLMEDIDISKKLKRIAALTCFDATVATSSRRWEKQGIFKTIILMWWLRLAYFGGISENRLSNWYRNE